MMVKKNHPRFQWYCFISSYAIHLEKYYSKFKEEHILILLMDDFKNNSLEIYQKVCRFIGVDGNYIPSIIGKRQNQQTLPKIRSIEKLLTTAQQSLFADKIPDRLRSSLGMLRRVASKMNSRRNLYPLMPTTMRIDLLERFQSDIVFVENLLGRNLNSWRKV
jgi:hypothetical protein